MKTLFHSIKLKQ